MAQICIILSLKTIRKTVIIRLTLQEIGCFWMTRKGVVVMNHLANSSQKGAYSMTGPEFMATLGVIALALIPNACYAMIKLIKTWRKR